MKKLIMKLTTGTATFVLLLFSMQAGAQNITGTWNMTVETDAGTGNPVFVLKHVNDTIISGTYTGMFGEVPVKGKIKNDQVVIQFSVEGNLIEYIGTVQGNTMKGKVKFGDMAEGTFTGVKQVKKE